MSEKNTPLISNLTKALEMIERNRAEAVDLFTFSHQNQDFIVRVHADEEEGLKLMVYEDIEQPFPIPLGEIIIVLTESEGEWVVKSLVTANYGIGQSFGDYVNKTPDHVKGLMSEVIKQCVKSGLVKEWRSASLRTKGGDKMYESIEADSELTVEKKGTQYIVTKTRTQ